MVAGKFHWIRPLIFCCCSLLVVDVAVSFSQPAFRTVHRSLQRPPIVPYKPCIVLKGSSNDAEMEARRMREQAEKIRAEIAAFEAEKQSEVQREQAVEAKVRSEKQQVRLRYSAEVPILKGDGSTVMERVDFPPLFKDGKSQIVVCTASVPLGLVLGESEDIVGAVCVDEVAEGSNGEASGVKAGDLLRACTACQMVMDTPTWQILAGGIGVPKTKRFMCSVDARPFEEVLDAVSSNRMDPEERPAVLVLERRDA